jgi:tRNA modification GTPase
MRMPALDDTIIAVSSGWQISPLGIVRLSGPDAFDLLAQVGVTVPASSVQPGPGWCEGRLVLGDDFRLPVTLFWFRTPRSYTGQDVAEIHTVGSLPALRAVSARLIQLGARRALPGEFTARAFLNGRLEAEQVDGVLALVNAEDEAAARRAARLGRGTFRERLSVLGERVTEVLALVEAGIDFVEEEDVRFITTAELKQALDELIDAASSVARSGQDGQRSGTPHVALAGLPNAGKSTLFNELLGYQRAIVAPVLGTTRDVLSAEIDIGGVMCVLQDCAGFGTSTDELEAAAHLAAEQAAEQADLILWLHECTADWDPRASSVCRRIPANRRLLVISKLDQAVGPISQPTTLPFAETVEVSAVSGAGLRRLRGVIAERLGGRDCEQGDQLAVEQLEAAGAALRRAREVATGPDRTLALPEIVALELREARDALEWLGRGPVAEDVLGKIFARFCIGK